MSIAIAPYVKAAAEAFVSRGEYPDADAVMRDALKLLEMVSAQPNVPAPDVDALIAEGLESLDAGRGSEAGQVLSRIRAETVSPQAI